MQTVYVIWWVGTTWFIVGEMVCNWLKRNEMVKVYHFEFD